MTDSDGENGFSIANIEASPGFLKGVIDSIQNGAALYDADDRLVYFNEAYTQYFKLVADILKPGISFPEIFRALGERGLYDGPDDEIDAWLEKRLKMFHEGTIANEVRRNDGRWVRIDYYKLEHGGTFVVSADITKRKQDEEALRNAKEELETRVEERTAELRETNERLRESEALLRAIMDNSPSHIYLKDVDGRYLLVNKNVEHTIGLPADRILGRTHHDFYPPHLTRIYAAQDREVVETRSTVAVEVEVPQADGPPQASIIYKFPIFDENGEVEAIGAVIVDIEERKQAEIQLKLAKEAAEAANQAKSLFLANMSHELRTPLNAVIGYSELLMETAEDEGWDDAISDLLKIQASGRHLLSLINNVLDLSKIEAGKMDLFMERFDIHRMVDQVSGTVQPLAMKNGNAFVVDCPDDVGEMYSDLTKVRQALVNLLSNACKFSTNGTVALRVTRRGTGEDGRLEFAVSDTGIGMSTEEIGNIFEAFTQVDASSSREFGGTGLGLAITRRFCTMLGGDIRVASEPGRGSTFTIELPANAETVPHAEPDESTILTRAATPGRPTVLVIDDDPVVRDLLTRHLVRYGYNVSVAESGRVGLTMARARPPDAITLDVLMPGMDGWSVLTELKEDPVLSEIPVIIITIVEERNVGFSLGATGYLSKPIDPAKLVGLLRQHCVTVARVLLVEDEAAMRELVRRSLEKENCVVSEAENGREALEILSAQAPDLIVLDLMMPEMDGFEFLSTVRESEAWRDIPVVVMTAKTLTAEDRHRLSGGAEMLLDKSPESIDTLIEKLRNLSAENDGGDTDPAPRADGTGPIADILTAASFDSAAKPTSAAVSVSSAPGADKRSKETGSGHAGRILIVDDTAYNRELLVRQLKKLGHAVTAAGGGQQALALVGTARFDAILLDVMMPDMNGLDVLTHLKSGAGTKDIPVIMVSANTEDEMTGRCLENGAVAYLSKPVAVAKLRDCLNRYVDAPSDRNPT